MLSKKQAARRQYRIWRAGVGLTQMDTAIRIGMARERYWRIENGYDAPTEREVEKLAKLFNVAPEQMEAVAS